MTRPAIEIRGLTVAFGPKTVVHGIDLCVDAGECFGIVGESGSGKSTILRTLVGLIPDWSGSISIMGLKQGRRRDRALSRTVQMVFQDPYGSLHPRMTIDDTLGEPLHIHGARNAAAQIARALDEVGLPHSLRFRFPHQLSGGQRQRVAIARALILKPAVLLLDEPTSALDVSVQAEILNLLADLQAESKATYVLVSHDLAVVGAMCGRLLVMQHGRAVEEMPSQALRDRVAATEYARQLLAASDGFHRTAMPTLIG
jgi:peptide/nickel transport system ATP-binding protein